MQALIQVKIHDQGNIEYRSLGNYESRYENMVELLGKVFEILDVNLFSTKEFFVSTRDIPTAIDGRVTFGFTKARNVVTCPDYTFCRWVECGINDYGTTIANILAKSEQTPVSDKLFWIGNPRTQALRLKLLAIGNANRNKLSIIPMDWLRDFPKGRKHRYTHYVSLEDHSQYKYLIDCGAAGYSGRLKFLLHTNRPLFIVDRQDDTKEYFHDDLVPFQHFIPVKEDLSDLLAMLAWADENYDQALKIAAAAKKFAMERLNQQQVIFDFSRIVAENLM